MNFRKDKNIYINIFMNLWLQFYDKYIDIYYLNQPMYQGN